MMNPKTWAELVFPQGCRGLNRMGKRPWDDDAFYVSDPEGEREMTDAAFRLLKEIDGFGVYAVQRHAIVIQYPNGEHWQDYAHVS